MTDEIENRKQFINRIMTNTTYGRFRSREEIEQELNEADSIVFTPYNVVCTPVDETSAYTTDDCNLTYDTITWRGRTYNIEDLVDCLLNKKENKDKEVKYKWEDVL